MTIDRAALSKQALAKARESLSEGDLHAAGLYLGMVSEADRPNDLQCFIAYAEAKNAMADGHWSEAVSLLEKACAKGGDSLAQRRLGLSRQWSSFIADESWEAMRKRISPADRLPTATLRPRITSVWACGAYYSRIKQSDTWTKVLRWLKNPQDLTSEERDALLKICGEYMCRFIAEETDALADIDVVVAIPPNPFRYADRQWSLPDKLAQCLERQLALPYERQALRLVDDTLELRGLSRAERRRRIVGAMAVGNLGLAADRNVLIVDDVITSGATLREAARILLDAEASAVWGIAMSHTEG